MFSFYSGALLEA